MPLVLSDETQHKMAEQRKAGDQALAHIVKAADVRLGSTRTRCRQSDASSFTYLSSVKKPHAVERCG
jgi:hypothetical protein